MKIRGTPASIAQCHRIGVWCRMFVLIMVVFCLKQNSKMPFGSTDEGTETWSNN